MDRLCRKPLLFVWPPQRWWFSCSSWLSLLLLCLHSRQVWELLRSAVHSSATDWFLSCLGCCSTLLGPLSINLSISFCSRSPSLSTYLPWRVHLANALSSLALYIPTHNSYVGWDQLFFYLVCLYPGSQSFPLLFHCATPSSTERVLSNSTFLQLPLSWPVVWGSMCSCAFHLLSPLLCFWLVLARFLPISL